jgi:hypothetical protein
MRSIRDNPFICIPCAVIMIIIGASSGCEALSLNDVDRFIALIQDTDVLGTTNGQVVYEHVEYAQCPPHNAGPLGDALQPAQCNALSSDRATVQSLFTFDAAALTATPIELPLPRAIDVRSDGRRITGRNSETNTLYTYDIEADELSSHLNGGAAVDDGSVVAIDGDSIAMVFSDENHEQSIRVYSIQLGTFIDDVEIPCEGFVAAMEGEWLVCQRASASEADAIIPDFLDVILMNIRTGEERVLATNIDDASLNSDIWIQDGVVVWTTGRSYFEALRYDIADDMTETIYTRDVPGSLALAATILTDVGPMGFLVAEESNDEARSVAYKLISWEGVETTLFEFNSANEFRPWYRNNQLRFAGERIVWTDPQTGEFVVFDPTTASSGRYDPYSR